MARKNKRQENIKLTRVLKDMLNEKLCDRVLEGLFPEQLAFIQDPSEMKAALCTRRCGKTRAAAAYLIYTALKYPGSVAVYVHMTRNDAKSDMLTKNRFIPIILEQFKIEGAEINYSELTITFPNKSVIWLTGVDATPDSARILLGKKYRLLIVDEAGSFRQDLKQIITRVRPAMAQGDHSGTLALIGTPENNRGHFYRVTCTEDENTDADTGQCPSEPGWSLHQWTYEANPYERDALRKQVTELKENYPGCFSNESHALYPVFQQHYLGRWVIDRNALVYAYDPNVNSIGEDSGPYGLPAGNADWTFAAGVDFGFSDPFTIVVVAYRPHDPNLYVVDCFKQRELDVTQVGIECLRYKMQYGIGRMVADHEPAVVQDVWNKHRVMLTAAEKIDKVPFIQLMNGEYIRGRIKLLDRQELKPLVKELEELIWDKKLLVQGLKKEDQGKDNHLTDALLYVWRELFYYLAKPASITETDPMVLYSQQLRSKIERRMRTEQARRRRPGWKKR